MNKRPTNIAAKLPFTKDEVMDEVRVALLCHASQIALTMGDDNKITSAYIGFEMESWYEPDLGPETRAQVDLDRFWIAKQISAAFDFAFQHGDIEAMTRFSEDDWLDIGSFRDGASRAAWGGEVSPLGDEDSKLSRTLDTALARMNLKHGHYLTIRQLALLAGMGETAVRTSLSAEGIKTEGKTDGRPAQLAADVAEAWLRRRRGFIPTFIPGETEEDQTAVIAELFRTSSFREALTGALVLRKMTIASLASEAEVDAGWLDGLLHGRQVSCDLDALQRIAIRLGTEVPPFVGRAVEAILREDNTASQEKNTQSVNYTYEFEINARRDDKSFAKLIEAQAKQRGGSVVSTKFKRSSDKFVSDHQLLKVTVEFADRGALESYIREYYEDGFSDEDIEQEIRSIQTV